MRILICGRRGVALTPAWIALTTLAGAAAAQDSPWMSTQVIGQSRLGRDIEAVTLAKPGQDALGRRADERPALLIVAGADGRHTIGRLAATGVGLKLLSDHKELLETHTVYIVPNLNPDAAARLRADGAMRTESGRNAAELDADGDRRIAEDGGDDLNGDAMITMMRVENPPPEYGLAVEWVADDDEPRLLRKAKGEDGEVGRYALLIEGLDNDGDGKFNEDGPAGASGGGVDLDMNFPSLYPEHKDGAGAYPLSEPESLSFVKWIIGHDNIVAVLVYGPNDNLVNVPATGKFDESGRMPRGLEKDDEAYHKAIAELFKEETSMTGAPTGSTDGSLAAYTYTDFGVWTFSTPVWVRPDQIKKAEEKEDKGEKKDEAPAAEPEEPNEAQALRDRGVPEEIVIFITATTDERAAIMAEFEESEPEEQQARMAQIGQLPDDVRLRVMALAQGQADPGAGDAAPQTDRPARPGRGEPKDKGKGKPKADKDELAWLKYSDDDRDGEGFIEWTEFDHPQLGKVEIGGFVPGFRLNPPADEQDALVAQQTEFVAALLEKLPTFDVGEPTAESLGAGLWRVRVRVTNNGFLPTSSAMGVKARRIPPEVVSIEVDPKSIVSGRRVVSFQSVSGSGAHEDAEWVISAEAGQSIEIITRSPVFGDRTASVELKEGR